MSIVLPENPRHLRWMLARKLGAAAIAIGLVAGGLSYQLETRRAEQSALENAAEGARHFESSATQIVMDTKAPEEHAALKRLLDRSRFVAIRVFNSDRVLIYET